MFKISRKTWSLKPPRKAFPDIKQNVQAFASANKRLRKPPKILG